jgi:predicted nucleic acid-binding protein
MNFVLDASVTLAWLLGDARSADRNYAQGALEALKQADSHAEVPVTWSLEVSNVIARAEAKGLLSEAQSEAFLGMLSSAPVCADAATGARQDSCRLKGCF